MFFDRYFNSGLAEKIHNRQSARAHLYSQLAATRRHLLDLSNDGEGYGCDMPRFPTDPNTPSHPPMEPGVNRNGARGDRHAYSAKPIFLRRRLR